MKNNIFLDIENATFSGKDINKRKKLVSECSFLFQKNNNLNQCEDIMYEVEWHNNKVEEGTYGGLFLGITHIYPGNIEGEFYMTAGHIHQDTLTAEYYVGMKGNGLLLLVFPDKHYEIEKVTQGSIHYIPGNTIHRLINIGEEILSVGACWQSVSGHDYDIADIPVRIFKEKENTYQVIGQ